MKKRLMAVVLCLVMVAVLFTPYATVLTEGGALSLGFAGADNGEEENQPTEPEQPGEDEPADKDDQPAGDEKPADENDQPAGDEEPADENDQPAGDEEPADENDQSAGDEEPADENDQSELSAAIAKVEIKMETLSNVLIYGDEIRLTAIIPAELTGVLMQWQQSVSGGEWTDIPGETGTEYVFKLTEKNENASWRVVFTVE